MVGKGSSFKHVPAMAIMMMGTLLCPAPLIAEAPPEELWLTEDGDTIVATGPSDSTRKMLCGIVAGLPGAFRNPELARNRELLCGLPLIWGLVWNRENRRWTDGKILDPSTEEIFNLSARATNNTLILRIWAGTEWLGTDVVWSRATSFEEACPFQE